MLAAMGCVEGVPPPLPLAPSPPPPPPAGSISLWYMTWVKMLLGGGSDSRTGMS